MNHRMGRRAFLRGSAAGTLMGGAVAGAGEDAADSAERLIEAARETPVADRADVLVCGSGPAGIAAAVSAARTGARTRLLEVNGCLGGTWTAGLLSWILDAGHKDQRRFIHEVMNALDARGALRRYGGSRGYDIEEMKLLLDDLCAEAGVEVQLHTRVTAAIRGASNRMTHVVTESKSGRQAWAAKAFVDATGDGDVAALAGCGFDMGHEETGQCQPMSFICLLTGLDPEAAAPFIRGIGEGNPKDTLREEMERAGVSPSYSLPTLFCIRDNLYCLMANHEYHAQGTDAGQVTRATQRGRREVFALVAALRAHSPAWKDALIVATPEHIGVREGRRIHGRYTVTVEDLTAGARHDDAVCRVHFPVDVHSTDPERNKGIPRTGIRATPYDIPYRAMLAREVDGLLMAGRCISGDFIAHSSYRVTGNAASMGEAAGIAAALAASSGRLPHEVPWDEIGARLPG